MQYVDEYRDAHLARRYARAIASMTTRPWTLMEICGGQTHAIVKYGLDDLLPDQIELIHGPGCPVCVTPVETIDTAIAIASHPEVTFCSFGDMLRVPGSDRSLLEAKAAGADVRIVYSPMDALKLARDRPDRQVVFFAVGFETTAPATAMAAYQAGQQQIENFSMVVSHVLVPPAIEAILSAPQNRVQGFLAAGHVCTVAGYDAYEPITRRYDVPIVVTGFEPVDILQGIHACVRQLEAGEVRVENQYARSVHRTGNEVARTLIQEVFEVGSQRWRGIGEILDSGLRLRAEYAEVDAENRFAVFLQNAVPQHAVDSTECISGSIMQGDRKPHQCPAFGTRCTPDYPLGAPMVSSEGACAAYFRYRQRDRCIACSS